MPCLPVQEQSPEERKEREEERREARAAEAAAAAVAASEHRRALVARRKAGCRAETTSESEAGAVRSEGCHSNPEQSERRARHTLSFQERGTYCGCHEPRSSHLRKPHAGTLRRRPGRWCLWMSMSHHCDGSKVFRDAFLWYELHPRKLKFICILLSPLDMISKSSVAPIPKFKHAKSLNTSLSSNQTD